MGEDVNVNLYSYCKKVVVYVEIANCSRCFSLFNNINSTFCHTCLQEDFDKIDNIKTFLKNNLNATVEEIEKEMLISSKITYRYIYEGKLNVTPHPYLGYPCLKCNHVLIKRGKLCPPCGEKLKKDWERQDAIDKLSLARKKDFYFHL